jgi:hypothetical protein
MFKKSISPILLLLMVSFFACNKTKNPLFCSWEIEKTIGENPFLKGAEKVDIYEDHIVFSNDDQTMTFNAFIRSNHLILQNQTNKWLFTIKKLDNGSLWLQEKYAKDPLIFSLIKNDPQEN